MTPAFLTPLRLELVSEADDTWKVVAPLQYRSVVLGALIEVPDGFVTDMASVPRVPIVFWLTGDTAHAPAVVHDFLYQQHIASKSQADDVFEEAMQVVGVPWWRRSTMARAVRWFGAGAYASGPARLKILNPCLCPEALSPAKAELLRRLRSPS